MLCCGGYSRCGGPGGGGCYCGRVYKTSDKYEKKDEKKER